jgi:GH15 family glucan-1,4-alpha-glucosidase
VSSRIEQYAMVGDTQTAALIGDDGSVDWMCAPRFDSGACFAALLGNEDNGRWLIAPAAGGRATRRRYRDHTLVLETEFETAEGAVRIIDFMPIRDQTVDVIRIVEGLRGHVPMQMHLTIRFDYGQTIPWVRNIGGALVAVAGPDALVLRAPVETKGVGHSTVAEFTVRAGQRVPFNLAWYPSHHDVPRPRNATWALSRTESWWHNWSKQWTYDGDHPEAVQRSVITLKALTYAPTGGIVAAPTTSLPEWIGGVRNWDYRFCWLRDATFTLYAMLMAGYEDEAEAWREWLLRAVAGDPRDLRIMYGLAGERRMPELEIEWLPGYEDSLPVRVGNDASRQFQLDVYGEVLDLLHQASREGLPHEAAAWEMELRILDVLESAWREPDEGIWEVRGGRQHFTHSKVMAWVGVDRAIRDVELFGFPGPVDRWRALRDEIHHEIMSEAFDDEIGSFVQSYGSKEMDAALLMLPFVGFISADDPKMVGTVAAIQDRLMVDGFVRRYDTASRVDGQPGGEGAFIPCTCWLADCLSLQGHDEQARELFERVLDVRNDVGLLSEEYDVANGRLIGNFPQAFSHVSVIGTARNLSRGMVGPAERRLRRPRRVPRVALRGVRR